MDRLRSDGGTLKNETLRFAIGNLPERNKNAEYALLGVSILIILVVLFGFRRETTEGGARLSLGHLEAERDRLIKALARMRKAHEKGECLMLGLPVNKRLLRHVLSRFTEQSID